MIRLVLGMAHDIVRGVRAFRESTRTTSRDPGAAGGTSTAATPTEHEQSWRVLSCLDNPEWDR